MKPYKIGAGGRITLNASTLKHLAAKPGDRLSVGLGLGGSVVLRAQKGEISQSFGMLKHRARKRLTIAQINRLTATGWAGEL